MHSFSQTSSDKIFRGPWNRLLNTLFPFNSRFEVTPIFYSAKHSGPIGLFTVHILGSPVFFLHVLSLEHFHSPLSQVEADAKMRDFFLEFSLSVQIPVLHGICAFGTKLAFYSFHKLSCEVEPKATLSSPSPGQISFVANEAPLDRWSDITEPAGAREFQEIVDQVKEMCAQVRVR